MAQPVPELAKAGAALFILGDEDAVVLALDFLQPITENIQEIRVRGQDRSVETELDDRMRAINRLDF